VIELGLMLAVGCALLTNLGLLCKHRGAVRAPDVHFSHPLRSGADLFRSRWWTIGFIVSFAAWGLHAAALAMAPLSMVQAVIAGGLALLVLPASRWFGIKLGVRELVGLVLSASGLAFLALTTAHHDPSAGSHYTAGTMAAFEGGAIVIGAALLLSAHRGDGHRHGGLLLGAAAGLLLGTSDVALKALAEVVPGTPLAIISPWTLVAAGAGFVAFYALARSLQVGDPVSVIVISSVFANVAAIVGGVLVFGDPMGSDTLSVAARSAAFAAVILAAALIPAAPRNSTPQPQLA
jgi:multidrug transporter EmrE-like cation transporter